MGEEEKEICTIRCGMLETKASRRCLGLKLRRSSEYEYKQTPLFHRSQ